MFVWLGENKRSSRHSSSQHHTQCVHWFECTNKWFASSTIPLPPLHLHTPFYRVFLFSRYLFHIICRYSPPQFSLCSPVFTDGDIDESGNEQQQQQPDHLKDDFEILTSSGAAVTAAAANDSTSSSGSVSPPSLPSDGNPASNELPPSGIMLQETVLTLQRQQQRSSSPSHSGAGSAGSADGILAALPGIASGLRAAAAAAAADHKLLLATTQSHLIDSHQRRHQQQQQHHEDIEHSIPASFIHDPANVNMER